MTTRPIPPALAGQYRGAGIALAAITGGQVVALRYLVDVAPPDVADAIAEGGPHGVFFARQWLATAEAGRIVRELQALGDVIVGMCSAWEITEI